MSSFRVEQYGTKGTSIVDDETPGLALGPLFVAVGNVATRLYDREGQLLLELDPGEALDLCGALMARQAALIAAYGEWFMRMQLQGS